MERETGSLSGTVLEERYRVAERLGDTDRSKTYRGRNLGDDRDVALKVLGLDDLSDWVEMEAFEQEIAVLKGLDHPNIPAYVDSFRTMVGGHEHIVLVTEYLPGDNLLATIRSGQRISDKSLRGLVTSILETLAYIHNLHPPLLHLSVSPENLVFAGQWHLVDFDATGGSARSQDAAGLSGDAAFVAPEVAGGEPEARSDLYSLGKCLQFVLTGDVDGDLGALTRKPGDKTVEFVRTLCHPTPAKRFASAAAALDFYRGKANRPSATARKKKTKAKKKSGGALKKALRKPLRTAAWVIPLGLVAFFAVRATAVGIRIRVHAPVMEAATRGNVVELDRLLEAGRSPSARNENDISALVQALLYQELQAARMLVEAGANVNYSNDLSGAGAGPAIATAALYGNTEFIDLLCDAGAVVDVRDYSGATPLTLCIGHGDIDGVRRLIQAEADLEFTDASGVPPLIHAIHEGQTVVARLLVDSGARADITRTADEYSAIQAAYFMYARASQREHARWLSLIDRMAESSPEIRFDSEHVTFAVLRENRDDYKTIGLLLDAGADLNAPDTAGSTALLRAAKAGRIETMNALLEMGADPNHLDNTGYSSLLVAREMEHHEMVALLKTHGAEEIVSEKSLMGAARMGDREAVSYLLEHGVDVNSSDADGTTVFMHAVNAGDSELIDLVESHGAAPELPDQFVLDMVRRNAHAGVQTLLARGFNLELSSRNEGTTLDIAVARGYSDLARLLRDAGITHRLSQDGLTREARRNNHLAVQTYLALGFSPNDADSRGDTPLLMATAGGATEVLDTLLSAGADPSIPDDTGRPPLMLASSRGDQEGVATLLRYGADINQRRATTGESALTTAIYNRRADTALYLLENGANGTITFQTGWSDRRGNTPLQLAQFFRLGDVVNALIERGAE
jgi:ankyrin repeat protein